MKCSYCENETTFRFLDRVLMCEPCWRKIPIEAALKAIQSVCDGIPHQEKLKDLDKVDFYTKKRRYLKQKKSWELTLDEYIDQTIKFEPKSIDVKADVSS